MKKLIIITFITNLAIAKAHSQNLVPNYSFETYSSCPVYQGELYKAVPWFNPSVYPSTSDYFNVCSNGVGVPNTGWGFQYPYTGDGFTGIYAWSFNGTPNAREYLEVQLTDTLVLGSYYCVSFFASLNEASGFGVANLGIYFSDTAVYSTVNKNFPFIPQIENSVSNPLLSYTNWMQVSGTYIAHGGEKYIVIGNFRNDSSTNVFYVDTTQLQYPLAYYYIDDVSVINCDSLMGLNEQSNISFTISPNPASEVLKITLPLNVSSTAFTIVNTMGTIVKQEKSTTPQNEMVIDIATLPRGVYFVKVKTNKGVGFKKFLKM